MDAFKTFKFTDGRKLEIHHDPDPMNPREGDNVGTMVCFHGRYELGDKDHGIDHTDFRGWDEMEAWIIEQMDGAIVLPLYLYDHSGLRIKVGSFNGLLPQGHAEFDSRQVGFIFVTNAKVKDEYGDDPKAMERAEAYLRNEVAVYDQYLCGDVYGFVLRDKPCEHCDDETGDELDSCWGLYGSDPLENGIAGYLSDADQKELATLV